MAAKPAIRPFITLRIPILAQAVIQVGRRTCLCQIITGSAKPKSNVSSLNRIERMFGRLKDWRRIATRYDRCAHAFMSAIAIAATIIFWL